jgi:hypothetical protein
MSRKHKMLGITHPPLNAPTGFLTTGTAPAVGAIGVSCNSNREVVNVRRVEKRVAWRRPRVDNRDAIISKYSIRMFTSKLRWIVERFKVLFCGIGCDVVYASYE